MGVSSWHTGLGCEGWRRRREASDFHEDLLRWTEVKPVLMLWWFYFKSLGTGIHFFFRSERILRGSFSDLFLATNCELFQFHNCGRLIGFPGSFIGAKLIVFSDGTCLWPETIRDPILVFVRAVKWPERQPYWIIGWSNELTFCLHLKTPC